MQLYKFLNGIGAMQRQSYRSESDRNLAWHLRRFLTLYILQLRMGSLSARLIFTAVTAFVFWALLSVPDAFSASVTRTTSFAYDPATGLLVSETIEPSDPSVSITKTYQHDLFGNQIAETVSASGMPSRTTSTTYDARGQFVEEVENVIGHKENWTYDKKLGVPLTQTGPNGLTTSWDYSIHGRKIKETAPIGAYTETEYLVCQSLGGTATCPTNGAYVIHTLQFDADGVKSAPWARAYFDGHGRSIRTEVEDELGSTIVEDTEYDAFGRVAKQCEPYFWGGAKAQTPVWVKRDYDALNRLVKVTMPDQSTMQYAYNGLSTSITNELGQVKTSVKDVRGNLVSVTDPNGKTITYKYDAFGNQTEIHDMAGNVIKFKYDKVGRKIETDDPDLGLRTYEYNAFGELLVQTMADGRTLTHQYDLLGRPTNLLADMGDEDEAEFRWTYDTAGNGIGKLHTARTVYRFRDGILDLGYNQFINDTLEMVVSTGLYQGLPNLIKDVIRNLYNWIGQKTLTYDEFGRVTRTQMGMWGTFGRFDTTYDRAGRIDKVTYPSGFAVQHNYDAFGRLDTLKQAAGGTQTFWAAGERDARQRLLNFWQGNMAFETKRTYDPLTNFLTAIEAGNSGAIADFSYIFDTFGNLRSRSDHNQGLVENFGYDVLNRLTSYNIVGGSQKTVTYDDTGNITSKTDVGTYAYPAPGSDRPHAVKSIAGTFGGNYTYDANGNMTFGRGTTVHWYPWNKIARILPSSGNQVSFFYGADFERVTKVSGSERTEYHRDAASGLFADKVVGAQTTSWTNYLVANGEMVGMYVDAVDNVNVTNVIEPKTRFFTTDHLGSIAVLTDEAGAVTERLSYDAWGKRRFPNGTDNPSGTITSETTRGYTGHEMIDEADLVNMNGRVYNPTIGRFLSADPLIPDATNSQALNRYSYVLNNPLSLIDPSGHSWWSKKVKPFFKKYWRTILAIVAAVVLQQFLLPQILGGFTSLSAAQAGAISGGVTGGVTNVIATGDPKSFFKGVVTGALSGGIAGSSSLGWGGKALANGAVGGTLNAVNGGEFQDGFLAAGFSSLAGNLYKAPDIWSGTAVGAVTGGIAAELGGGKFRHGAYTSAFAYATSYGAGKAATAFAGESQGSGFSQENKDAVDARLSQLKQDGVLSEQHGFATEDEAAVYLSNTLAKLSSDMTIEIGTNISLGSDGLYHYSIPWSGTDIAVSIPTSSTGFHTHPSGSPIFSNRTFSASGNSYKNDAMWVSESGRSLYVGAYRNKTVYTSVCEPGRCSKVGFGGTVGRVVQ